MELSDLAPDIIDIFKEQEKNENFIGFTAHEVAKILGVSARGIREKFNGYIDKGLLTRRKERLRSTGMKAWVYNLKEEK